MQFKLCIILLSFSLSFSCFGQRKVALIIGNKNYKLPYLVLNNAINDASGVEASLRKLGYEKIITYKDFGDLNSLKKAISSVVYDLEPEDHFVFWFSGHSFVKRGINYIGPVEAKSNEDFIPISFLFELLSLSETVNVIVLDACSSIVKNKENGPSNSFSDGYTLPRRTYYIVSSSIGQAAEDHGDGIPDEFGTHSIFAKSFMRNSLDLNLNINKVFDNVKTDVGRAYKDTQMPYSASTLAGVFSLMYGLKND